MHILLPYLKNSGHITGAGGAHRSSFSHFTTPQENKVVLKVVQILSGVIGIGCDCSLGVRLVLGHCCIVYNILYVYSVYKVYDVTSNVIYSCV